MMHTLFFFLFSDVADVLVPIAVAVVMPVLVIWLVMRARQNETDRKAEVMIKAIESGRQIDPHLFKSQDDSKTLKERVLGKLTGACVTSCLGIGFLLINFFWSDLKMGWNIPSLPLAGGVLLAVGIAYNCFIDTVRKRRAGAVEAVKQIVDREKRHGRTMLVIAFLEKWKLFLPLPVAGCAVVLGLIFSSRRETAF